MNVFNQNSIKQNLCLGWKGLFKFVMISWHVASQRGLMVGHIITLIPFLAHTVR